MEHLGNINLMKLDGARFVNIDGETCIVIPTERNNLWTGNDMCSLGFRISQRRSVGKNGETDYIKQTFTKGFIDKVGADVIKEKPFLGNCKPNPFIKKDGDGGNYKKEYSQKKETQSNDAGYAFYQKPQQPPKSYSSQTPYEDDDLPF